MSWTFLLRHEKKNNNGEKKCFLSSLFTFILALFSTPSIFYFPKRKLMMIFHFCIFFLLRLSLSLPLTLCRFQLLSSLYYSSNVFICFVFLFVFSFSFSRVRASSLSLISTGFSSINWMIQLDKSNLKHFHHIKAQHIDRLIRKRNA